MIKCIISVAFSVMTYWLRELLCPEAGSLRNKQTKKTALLFKFPSTLTFRKIFNLPVYTGFMILCADQIFFTLSRITHLLHLACMCHRWPADRVACVLHVHDGLWHSQAAALTSPASPSFYFPHEAMPPWNGITRRANRQRQHCCGFGWIIIRIMWYFIDFYRSFLFWLVL